MSTREFRLRAVFRNSMKPTRAATGCVVLAATLAMVGCKSEDATPPPNPEPPKAAPGPRVKHEAVPLAPESPAPPAPADVAAPPPDAQKTASGLAMKVLQPGSGSERVQPGQVFVITFASWDRSGKPISHIQHAEINLNSLAPGWAEAMLLMAPGETRRLWVPANLTRKPNVPDPRPMVDITVDLTLEYIGRLKMQALNQGAPVVQASAPVPSAEAAAAGSANGKPAKPASKAPKKH